MMADALRLMSKSGMLQPQSSRAQIMPVMTSSESPGRKKPINRPVSVKTIRFKARNAGIGNCGLLSVFIRPSESKKKMLRKRPPRKSPSNSADPRSPFCASARSCQIAQRTTVAHPQTRKRRFGLDKVGMMRFLHRVKDSGPCHLVQITRRAEICKEQFGDAQV